jgi:response regulator NasT
VPTSSSPNTRPSSDSGPSTALAGKRVVICEDEGVTQIQLTRLLKRAGLVVVGAANNGRTGVEIVLREKPDLVMMDIRMPIMDGLEATRLIMAENPVCIVMLTAFADEEVREEARKAGSSGFLLKPVTGEILLTALEQYYQAYAQKAPQEPS